MDRTMRAFLQLATAAVAAVAGFAAASMTAPAAPDASAGARPVISKVSPSNMARGQRLTVRGRGFVPGRRRNRIVFLGRRGGRDDVAVRATVGARRKITLVTSRRAAS